MVVRYRHSSDVSEEDLDAMFHALADSTRRGIMRTVIERERSVSDLARMYPMSFAAVQKHVAVLERCGLVAKRRRGREQMVCTQGEQLRKVSQLLEQLEALWRARVDQINDLL